MGEKKVKERKPVKWSKRIPAIVIFYIMIVIGIGLLLSPMLEHSVITNASRQFTSVSFSGEQLAENIRNAGYFEVETDIVIPQLPEVLQNLPNIDNGNVIGIISIERVGVFLPIFHGATKVNLLAGAGTMHYDQVMGEGNYPLAGHHMSDSSLLFGPLLDMRMGDLVQLTDRRSLYTYRVVSTELVHQSRVDILDSTKIPTVTLFTCDTSNISTNNRFVVTAELIDITSLDAIGLTADGNMIITSKERGNPYLTTFQTMNDISISGGRQNGILHWILLIASISLAISVFGILLFTKIEKRYRYVFAESDESEQRVYPQSR